MNKQRELVAQMVAAICEYRRLAQVASERTVKLTVLGDLQSQFLGRAEGLQEALFLIGPVAALTVNDPVPEIQLPLFDN